MLFNPALIDLPALPADFLSARPNLLTAFDKLWDNQIMPKTKNNVRWREKLAILVAAATEGTYTENWNYPPVQHLGFLGVRTQMVHCHFCLKM